MSYQDQRAVTDLLHAIKNGATAAPLRHIPRRPLPAALQSEAQTVGGEFDSNSLEQGD